MVSVILYTILGIILVFVAIRFALVISMKQKQGRPAPELDGKMGKAIRRGKRVLLYFYGPTCPPCVQMAPIIEKIAQEVPNIYKIDVTKEMPIARKFGVMGTPAVVVIENGVIQQFKMGFQNEAALKQLLN